MEFDRRCGTAQTEDCLQLYIPAVSPAIDEHIARMTSTSTHTSNAAAAAAANSPAGAEVSAWWPVLSKFHGVDGWPTTAIILPGERFILPVFT